MTHFGAALARDAVSLKHLAVVSLAEALLHALQMSRHRCLLVLELRPRSRSGQDHARIRLHTCASMVWYNSITFDKKIHVHVDLKILNRISVLENHTTRVA